MRTNDAAPPPATPAEVVAEEDRLYCRGAWTLDGVPGLRAHIDALPWPPSSRVSVHCGGITALDTAGAWLLAELVRRGQSMGCEVRLTDLAPAHEILLKLVQSRASAKPSPAPPAPGLFAALGWQVWTHLAEARDLLAFLGEASLTLLRTLTDVRRLRWRLVLHHIQHTGLDALPIVGLLSFLVGMVIAYQAATQLARYGANIFVVDLIAHSLLRELAPMLVAVIVAGRSGSAFAAQLGTMKVSEEIDALRTLGIPPQEMLVVPRLLALCLVMPLLTVYAEVLGVLGGFVVAFGQLGVDWVSFLDRFDDTIRVSTFLFGIGKAPVFAFIIAVVGCYQGFRAAGSADSVGRQTTRSVVQAIFLVIIVDAIFSVLASVTRLGFR